MHYCQWCLSSKKKKSMNKLDFITCLLLIVNFFFSFIFIVLLWQLAYNSFTYIPLIYKPKNEWIDPLVVFQLMVVKQEDKLELIFKHFLVEDKSNNGGASYVDFLCHMHKEIRQLLSWVSGPLSLPPWLCTQKRFNFLFNIINKTPFAHHLLFLKYNLICHDSWGWRHLVMEIMLLEQITLFFWS